MAYRTRIYYTDAQKAEKCCAQLDESVAYYAAISGGTAFITKDGRIFYDLSTPAAGLDKDRSNEGIDGQGNAGQHGSHRWVLQEAFVGSGGTLKAGAGSPTRINIFKGRDPARWHSRIPTYKSVMIEDFYPGIDMRFEVRGQSIEKIFTVAPGKDPASIRLEMSGQHGLLIDEQGKLIVTERKGHAGFSAPVAWQTNKGGQQRVAIDWKIISGNRYGFEVGQYHTSLPLVCFRALSPGRAYSRKVPYTNWGNIR